MVWAAGVGAPVIEPPYGVQQNGWSDTSRPPFQWFNWLLNKLDAWSLYLRARGIPDYDAAEIYSPGDVCQWTDGLTYRRIGTGNTSVAPSDTSFWTPWPTDPRAPGAGEVSVNAGTVSNAVMVRVPGAAAGTGYKTLSFLVTDVGSPSYNIHVTLSGRAAFTSAVCVAVCAGDFGPGSVAKADLVAANVWEIAYPNNFTYRPKLTITITGY
jgi:hypothetical protein